MEFNTHLAWLEEDKLRAINHAKLQTNQAGRIVYDMTMINPDLPPPRFLIDKLLEASLKSYNHVYAISRGVRKARQGFADKYRRAFGVELDPEREICLSMGTKDALLHVLKVLTSPGDAVLLGKPAYPSFISAINYHGLIADYFELNADSNKMLSEIEAKLSHRNFKVLLLNFPNNPTGITVDRDFFDALVRICQKYNCFILNDFAYGEMQYSGMAPSLLDAKNARACAVETYTLSKAYSVPGWRVGALLGNEKVVQQFSRLKSHMDYGIFLPLQIAASAGLSSEQSLVTSNLREYETRAKTLVKGLSSLSWQVEMPVAGCTVWARPPRNLIADGSSAFALKALQEKSVAFLPGRFFGEEFDQFVRFALVLGQDKITGVLNSLSGLA